MLNIYCFIDYAKFGGRHLLFARIDNFEASLASCCAIGGLQKTQKQYYLSI